MHSRLSRLILALSITAIIPARGADLTGIASGFLNDAGINQHPSVIFVEDFETDGFRERWDEVRDKDGKVLSREVAADSDVEFGHSLKVSSVLGRDTGGGLTKWFESADLLHIRFYTLFDEGCDYLHHFVTLRANRSLRGGDRWSGFGGAGVKPEGDERFSTALEPWGNWGNWPAPGRWNFYSYWHEMTASPDGKFWGNSFKPEIQSDIPKERWICAEFMLKHNTPGEHDGEQAFWIDGVEMGRWSRINWRKTDGLMANALTLESYVTDRWTKNRTNIVWFDNLVIAREYIGPMGAGPQR